MPTLKLDGLVNGELLSWMFYPRDEVKRRQSSVTYRVKACATAPHTDHIFLTQKDALTILASPSWDAIKLDEKQLGKRGFIAGSVLAVLYLSHIFKDRSIFFIPSMNRAIFAVRRMAVNGGRFGDGSEMPRSERYVRECWNDFSPVAHFWATLALKAYGYPYPNQDSRLLSPEAMPGFLSASQGMYKFGTQFVPEGSHQQTPILDRSEALAPPKNYEPLTLVSERVPETLRKILQAYRVTETPKRRNS